MRILGIDPGYAILGYGIIDVEGNHFKAIEYGAVTTEAGMDMPDRLKVLYNGLMEIIDKYNPQQASIEELFFNTNNKTAILVGQARGVAILACANSGLEIFEYTPLQIKQGLVGYGRADKKQIQQMVKIMLNLRQVPKPDDTADALAAADMSRQYGCITKTNGEDYQMIHYIKGTLAMKLDTGIVVETGGIGYDISVPGNSSLYLRSEGDEVICYTAMIVREDDVSLYGFADRESLELFRLLITVSGVGAKAAMAVLSALTSSQLRQAIAFEDDKAIATANGVGKKQPRELCLNSKTRFRQTTFQFLSSR